MGNNEKNENYYGSELNRHIDKNCEHDFTSINIDCFQLKWESKVVRFIESKHTLEPLGDQQLKALKLLATHIKLADGWQVKVYIVRGDPPYEKIDVQDLITNEKFKVIGEENVIDWLSL